MVLQGPAEGLALTIDGQSLGPARPGLQLPLIPGSHLLALRDADGRMLDQIRFTVR